MSYKWGGIHVAFFKPDTFLTEMLCCLSLPHLFLDVYCIPCLTSTETSAIFFFLPICVNKTTQLCCLHRLWEKQVCGLLTPGCVTACVRFANSHLTHWGLSWWTRRSLEGIRNFSRMLECSHVLLLRPQTQWTHAASITWLVAFFGPVRSLRGQACARNQNVKRWVKLMGFLDFEAYI